MNKELHHKSLAIDNYLQKVYTDPKLSGAFTGPAKFYKWLKLHGKYKPTLKYVKKWLQGAESYTLHREIKRKFPRNKVYVSSIDELWDIDLADFQNISKYNDGYRYVLYAIDILSRRAWAQPLKTKKPVDVIKGLKAIFNEGRKPLRIRSDKGSEFIAASVQKFFKEQNIVHTKSQSSDIKANYVERLIRSNKRVIYQYFTHNNTYRYIDKLQDFIDAYNGRVHRSHKRTPISVTKENEKQVWFDLYAEPLLLNPGKNPKVKFKVGDLVRITHIKSPFTRSYNQLWSGEIFSIASISHQARIPLYRLIDYHSEPIIGNFYAQELQKADIDPDKPYKIEAILKTRTRGDSKEYFVKYLYWPKKFNQWVSEDAVSDI